jgi:hypothetical protein
VCQKHPFPFLQPGWWQYRGMQRRWGRQRRRRGQRRAGQRWAGGQRRGGQGQRMRRRPAAARLDDAKSGDGQVHDVRHVGPTRRAVLLTFGLNGGWVHGRGAHSDGGRHVHEKHGTGPKAGRDCEWYRELPHLCMNKPGLNRAIVDCVCSRAYLNRDRLPVGHVVGYCDHYPLSRQRADAQHVR